jgi:cytoskeletal protein CcmA (bactofilin family)
MAWGSKSNDVSGSSGTTRSGNMMSFIGAEVVISGNISGSGDIHLDGVIEGDVACNTLILGAGGRIKGKITAERVTLGGAVDGMVDASTLTVEKSARVNGDLSYDMVSIETGAQIDGRMSHRVTLDTSLKLISSSGE